MQYEQLLKLAQETHQATRQHALSVVDQALLIRNWLFGFWIVEYEQKGEDRAKYGSRLFPRLSRDLLGCGVSGCSEVMLRRMRAFYQIYPQVCQAFGKPGAPFKMLSTIQEDLSSSMDIRELKIQSESLTELPENRLALSVQPLAGDLVLQISWSKIQELIRLDDPAKRAFYENGCLQEKWSLPELQRQINTMLYERTGLSVDKREVLKRSREGALHSMEEIIRDPYVLEFTGLQFQNAYLESDLEKVLLDHLQTFLLELGKGFCFEARQKRIILENEQDYIDLVFYHRILRCHLLIDLKVREFRHGDAGQMNFYLNWWKDNAMENGDNPPVGLILCTDHKKSRVQYATAGMDQNLFVSRYLISLPKPEELQELLERDRAFLAQRQEEKR